MTINDVIPYLRTIARKHAAIDDEEFNPCDSSGGNYDNTYYLDDGDILFARELLAKLGESY